MATGNNPNKTRRLVVGFFLLLFVDFLWVGSSELTRYIFTEQDFKRPFFTTYLKTCMFTIYLLGFMFHRPWRDQCLHPLPEGIASGEEADDTVRILSEPEFEPIISCSDVESEGRCSDAETQMGSDDQNPPDPAPSNRNVRFQRVHEIRRLPNAEAHAAVLSRLPYEMWLRAERLLHQYSNRLPIRKVAKLALTFSFLWFVGNLAYQEALYFTQAGIVTVLSSSSSLFTLVLAAVFPSCLNDRFTLSKFVAVLCSMGGVAVVTYVDQGGFENEFPAGALWALLGAVAYAFYLVMLRRRVDSEEKLDIPMFFGFVGLFCLVILWPGLYFLHATGIEPFYPLPNRTQMMYIAVNGIVGTVLSEYLWLWGCFLTSSLIATLSLSLTVPMTVIADNILWKETYPWLFFAGMIPIVGAFVGASLLAHYENWDPVYGFLRRTTQKLLYIPCLLLSCCRRKAPVRIRDLDREQTESLIVNG